ncbi:hypothetical protein [Adhaeribacter rhizoryzae]|uniref:Glycine zipper family protein n=1 Tax=Adhaeribacter rhizoryzae TaxID=2607907 RepID=A0A5M6D2N7_9BACT|nr:hypothetical protein [Adhaeribacter rhizoryzae]KAA5541266.1 hypothetical protein F0145_20915 [Adhaeribacter rhizoryzae]
MKTLIVFLLSLFLHIPEKSWAFPPGIKLAKATVYLTGSRIVNGFLFSVNDSSLEISRIGVVTSLNPEGRNNQKLAIKDISAIKVRRSDSAKAGGILGGIGGLILGSIIGNIAYKPCNPTPGFIGLSECSFEIIDKTGATIIGAGLGAATGTGIGILLGKVSKRFQISGNQQLFEQHKSNLISYLPKTN